MDQLFGEVIEGEGIVEIPDRCIRERRCSAPRATMIGCSWIDGSTVKNKEL
jgi:hypothetical protein